MTLNTAILIHSDINPKEVYDFLNNLVGKREDGLPTVVHAGVAQYSNDPNLYEYTNELGQGLLAILEVKYHGDGTPFKGVDYFGYTEEPPVIDPDDPYGSDGEEDSYYASLRTIGDFNIAVSLDTGYAYMDEFGGCGALHARFITALYNELLLIRGDSLHWINEFTGDVNENLEGIEELNRD